MSFHFRLHPAKSKKKHTKKTKKQNKTKQKNKTKQNKKQTKQNKTKTKNPQKTPQKNTSFLGPLNPLSGKQEFFLKIRFCHFFLFLGLHCCAKFPKN